VRVLVGTVISGIAKGYAVPKFEEMCAALFPDVDVVAVVDHYGQTSLKQVLDDRMSGSVWATEIVYYGKQTLRRYALDHDYDALVWQGIDCYYQSRADFDRLVKGGEKHPVIGGLIAGRNRPDYAVCRRFVSDTMEQLDHIEGDWPGAFLGVRQVPGYIGSDATLIRRDALGAVTMTGYQHWHHIKDSIGDKDAGGRPESGALGPEEYWMWSAINRHHIIPAIDARCRPWHAHETGDLARYPNQRGRLEDLSWPG
jgi:hypothetical protein